MRVFRIRPVAVALRSGQLQLQSRTAQKLCRPVRAEVSVVAIARGLLRSSRRAPRYTRAERLLMPVALAPPDDCKTRSSPRVPASLAVFLQLRSMWYHS